MSKLELRSYQTEILDHAKQRSVSARFETGAGKTLVAAELIGIIAARPQGEVKKVIVMIVPTVTLAYQQSTMILDQCPDLKVETMVGPDGLEFWRLEIEQTRLLNAADVLVCTAQVWLNILYGGYWSIDRISLLIFDEAHHAAKAHPYALIMTEHYHRIKSSSPLLELPKILGLTASPIFGLSKPEVAIDELERLTTARIVEVVDNVQELKRNTPTPVESVVVFDPLPKLPSSESTAFDAELKRWNSPLPERVEKQLRMTKQMLGTLCSDAQVVELLADAVAAKFPIDLPLQSAANSCRQKLIDQRATATNTSTRAYALINLLKRYTGQEDFHAMIFVERRQYVKILSDLIGREFKDFRCGFLVGHGDGNDWGKSEGIANYDVDMSIKQQKVVVESFRTGEINVLFTTSVAEEGLDFGKCNVVIRFDPLKTYLGYIQSRGRARHFQSDYIVLCEQGTKDASRYYSYVSAEPGLRLMYRHRPTTPPQLPDLEDLRPPFIVETTGALLSHTNAIARLAEFCTTLPLAADGSPSKPVYTDVALSLTAFKSVLKLPLQRRFRMMERDFEGDVSVTKKGTKQSAAFKACLSLYRMGCLDDRLLPMR